MLIHSPSLSPFSFAITHRSVFGVNLKSFACATELDFFVFFTPRNLLDCKICWWFKLLDVKFLSLVQHCTKNIADRSDLTAKSFSLEKEEERLKDIRKHHERIIQIDKVEIRRSS
jgi:hypothetical protein